MGSVDLDFVAEELSFFGCSLAQDSQTLDLLNEIAAEFEIDGEDLVNALIVGANASYKTSDRAEDKTVNVKALNIVRKNLNTNKEKQLLEERKHVEQRRREPLHERFSSGRDLNVSCVESDSSFIDDENKRTEISGNYAAFAPIRKTPSHSKYLCRSDRGKVVFSHSGRMFVPRSTQHTGKANIDLISPLPKEFYADSKAADIIEEKCNRMLEFAQLYTESYPEISTWTRNCIPSPEMIYMYGEIVCEGSGAADSMSSSTFHMLLDDENGSVIELDVSQLLENISLFPGQIVAFRGINESGNLLCVNKVYDAPFPKMASIPDVKSPVDRLHIWVAAGPFTSPDTCSYEPLYDLLENVKKSPPHVLVLMGPFVDRKNKFLNDPSINATRQTVLENLLIITSKQLEGLNTEVVLQCCANRDASSFGIFPASPMELPREAMRRFGKRVHSLPDPAVIRVCGVELALSGSEIIAHLSRSEWHKSSNQENADRISRLQSHCLRQRSLYPLCPAMVPSDTMDSFRLCRISNTPHVMILPSMLPASVKVVSGSLVCNPGPLIRGNNGTFLKIVIDLSSITDPAHISDSSLCEIVRI